MTFTIPNFRGSTISSAIRDSLAPLSFVHFYTNHREGYWPLSQVTIRLLAVIAYRSQHGVKFSLDNNLAGFWREWNETVHRNDHTRVDA